MATKRKLEIQEGKERPACFGKELGSELGYGIAFKAARQTSRGKEHPVRGSTTEKAEEGDTLSDWNLARKVRELRWLCGGRCVATGQEEEGTTLILSELNDVT